MPRVVIRALVATFLVWSVRTVLLGYSYYFSGTARRHHLETAFMILLALAGALAWTRRQRTDDTYYPKAGRFDYALLWPTLVGAWLLYLPALQTGFLSDDFVLFQRAVRGDVLIISREAFIRPAPLLVWRTFAALGAPPSVFHLLNVTLHGVNAFLVGRIAKRLGLGTAPSVTAAALFLTFPAAVESVAWCSGIHDVLMTTWVLVFVLCVVDARGAGPLAGVIVCILALATKETAVIAPVLGVVVSGCGVKRSKRLVVTAVLICASYAVWRVLAVGLPDRVVVPLSKYTLKEFVVRPFAALAVPWTQAELDRAPWLGFGAVAGFVALICCFTLKNGRAQLWHAGRAIQGVFWIVIAPLPAYSYLYVDPHLEGSRYLYLPLAGWSVLLATLLSYCLPRRLGARGVYSACGLLALVGTVGIVTHLRPWAAAAATRDALLASAVQVCRAPRCASIDLTQVPDSIRGAYVFRNGLPEALQLVGCALPSSTAGISSPSGCVFAWDGTRFVRIR